MKYQNIKDKSDSKNNRYWTYEGELFGQSSPSKDGIIEFLRGETLSFLRNERLIKHPSLLFKTMK